MHQLKYFSILFLSVCSLFFISCEDDVPMPADDEFTYNNVDYKVLSVKTIRLANLDQADISAFSLNIAASKVGTLLNAIDLVVNMNSSSSVEMENGTYTFSTDIAPLNINLAAFAGIGLNTTDTFALNAKSGTVKYSVNDGEGTIKVNLTMNDDSVLNFNYTGEVSSE